MPLKSSFGLLLLILVVSLPLFTHLDAQPLHEWDEARLATSALEMSHSNNWVVVTYHGAPDMWSTKPPLLIWIQALMIKVFGVSELAVRLPSALAAFGICLLIFIFFAKKFREPVLGGISAVLLVTVPGYVGYHGTRTGDYDSLLAMLMAGYAMFYFLYLEENRPKYLYITFILLTCAGLTKGVQGLMFLPALAIYTAYKKKVLLVLRQRELYIGIVSFLIFVIGYYLLREQYNPGYLAAVWQNELAGRYNTVLESHKGDGWFYYDWIVNEHFHDWYLLLLPGLLVGLLSRQKWLRDITIFSGLIVLTYFLVLSNAQTKIPWYAIPLYPFLSILAAVFLSSIFKILSATDKWKPIMSQNALPAIFLFFVFIIPYKNIVTASMKNDGDLSAPVQGDMEQFMKDVVHHQRNVDGYTILDEGIGQSLSWYYAVYKYEHVSVKKMARNKIDSNAKLITYLNDSKTFIDSNYKAAVLETFNNVTVYQLNGKKHHD